MLKSEEKQESWVMCLSLNKHHVILIYLDNTLEQEKKVKCYSFGIKNICKEALANQAGDGNGPSGRVCRMLLYCRVFLLLT
jgi:hypothetical protein